jgi:hypothetical protein
VLLKPKPFIEDVLSAWMLRTLDDEELKEYRRPFATPGEDRLPILMWQCPVPICGESAEAVEVVAAYAAWLAETPGLPKRAQSCRSAPIDVVEHHVATCARRLQKLSRCFLTNNFAVPDGHYRV